jgi:pimeloyl-ACP methyl ester carboxylesterase
MKMKYKIEGSGEPLVLVPGGLTGCISWEPYAQRLSPTRKVVRVQLMSVQLGLENKPLPDGYSLKTESEALKAALDEAVPDQALDIAAWSFGAASTLLYAFDNPQRVRTLTLIEPPAFWVLDGSPRFPGFEELKQSSEETRENVSEDELVRFVHLVGITPPNIDPRSVPQWPTWMKYRRSLRANFAPFISTGDRAMVDAFQPPVLLVKGTGSAPFLHAVIDALHERLPNNEVVEYPAGHAPHLVSMDRFLPKMLSFQEKGKISEPIRAK